MSFVQLAQRKTAFGAIMSIAAHCLFEAQFTPWHACRLRDVTRAARPAEIAKQTAPLRLLKA